MSMSLSTGRTQLDSMQKTTCLLHLVRMMENGRVGGGDDKWRKNMRKGIREREMWGRE